jgi:hypothetical protein
MIRDRFEAIFCVTLPPGWLVQSLRPQGERDDHSVTAVLRSPGPSLTTPEFILRDRGVILRYESIASEYTEYTVEKHIGHKIDRDWVAGRT